MARRAVLLINLGTPADATVPAVRQFLAEFLSDPLVIRLPRLLRWFNPVLGRLIAFFRARHALDMYRTIWTPSGSPLREISDAQRTRLSERLGSTWRVEWAMRYGKPSIPQQLDELRADRIDEVVIIPLYPQFSGGTTGSAVREIARWAASRRPSFRWHVVGSWCREPSYVEAQAAIIAQELEQLGWTADDTFLIFSAHSVPLSHLRTGDPYREDVEASASAVAERLKWPSARYRVAYQSRFGPTAWLGPATEEAALGLCRSGERRLLVCPVSFVSDCLETLEELAVRLAAQVQEEDAKMVVCPALNASPPFIDCLAALTEACTGDRSRSSPIGISKATDNETSSS